LTLALLFLYVVVQVLVLTEQLQALRTEKAALETQHEEDLTELQRLREQEQQLAGVRHIKKGLGKVAIVAIFDPL
jgi:hypothetical protein